MRHKMVIEIEFESDCVGFGENGDMTNLDLIKYMIAEVGFHGIIEISDEGIANGVKSIEKVS